jgi:hypothetical protein
MGPFSRSEVTSEVNLYNPQSAIPSEKIELVIFGRYERPKAKRASHLTDCVLAITPRQMIGAQ